MQPTRSAGCLADIETASCPENDSPSKTQGDCEGKALFNEFAEACEILRSLGVPDYDGADLWRDWAQERREKLTSSIHSGEQNQDWGQMEGERDHKTIACIIERDDFTDPGFHQKC
jgi:cytochrome c5